MLVSVDQIRRVLEREKITVPKLAKLLGVRRQTVNKWIREGKQPSRKNEAKLYALFPYVRPATVANLSETLHNGKWRVPLISQLDAGRGVTAVDPYPVGAAEAYIDVFVEVSTSAIAFRVMGDSMEPEFHEGEIVIIDPQVSPSFGDAVAAEILGPDKEPGHGDVTFKEYRPRGTGSDGSAVFDLVPLNPSYATITVNARNRGRIIGTMVAHHKGRRVR